jgi:predicted  nucleic acid-binding Zn-ribbon protein
LDFYRSEKSNQEKENLSQEIRELKELVQKNSLLIAEIKKEKEQTTLSSHDVTTSPDNENQKLLTKYEELVSKLTSLEETIAQDKQETLSEYQKFIKSGSQLDYKDTFVQFKDPLPLVEERVNKKLMLMSKTQEEAQNQINTLTEALDMLGTGMEELHNFINLKTARISDTHSTSKDNKQILQDFVTSLEIFEHEIKTEISKIVNDRFKAINSLLTVVTSKIAEIKLILDEIDPQTISQEKSVAEIENPEFTDKNTDQW